jgi:hypothetical protein
MGKVLNMFPEQTPIKERLLDFAAGDEALVKQINRMTATQLALAETELTGSLCAFVDRLEGLKAEFKKYMAEVAERDGGLLMVNAAINYVLEFCDSVPVKSQTDDKIDNAYTSVLSTEMHKCVEQAIRKVSSDECQR